MQFTVLVSSAPYSLQKLASATFSRPQAGQASTGPREPPAPIDFPGTRIQVTAAHITSAEGFLGLDRRMRRAFAYETCLTPAAGERYMN
jgi:hypothetical protein